MQKAYIYIGSNNDTKILESDKAIDIITKFFDGFSTYEIIGFWKGQKEKTLKVEIVVSENDNAKVVKLCKELKTELQQEAIMLEIINSNCAFIQ